MEIRKENNLEYTELLKDTLELINQKQAYMQKLIKNETESEREIFLTHINRLQDLILQKRKKLDEVKKKLFKYKIE